MDTIHIDTKSIPPPEQEVLARSCLKFIERILAKPGGREAIDRWKETNNIT